MRDAENTVKPLKEDKQFPGQSICTKTAVTKAKLYPGVLKFNSSRFF